MRRRGMGRSGADGGRGFPWERAISPPFTRLERIEDPSRPLTRDFQYLPFLPSVVVLNGRITPSLSSFLLSGTLTEVMLAAHVPSAAPVLVSLVTPTVPFRDTSSASTPAAHRPRSCCGALDHVGCHASPSMRRRICPKGMLVKWPSASWRMKYRACRMRRPPVLKSRCWRLISDQLWMASGRTRRRRGCPRRARSPRHAHVHRALDPAELLDFVRHRATAPTRQVQGRGATCREGGN